MDFQIPPSVRISYKACEAYLKSQDPLIVSHKGLRFGIIEYSSSLSLQPFVGDSWLMHIMQLGLMENNFLLNSWKNA